MHGVTRLGIIRNRGTLKMGGIPKTTGKLVNILIRKCDVDKSKRICEQNSDGGRKISPKHSKEELFELDNRPLSRKRHCNPERVWRL